METYKPELGQMIFGQPTGEFAMPDWVESMFAGVMDEVRRVYWNINQKQWEDSMDADIGPVHVRHYDWSDEPSEVPNLWVDTDPQQIRWYKHPGRGLSASHDYSPDQWIAWHDAIVGALRQADEDKFTEIRSTDPTAGSR